MAVIQSKLTPRAEEFRRNAEVMRGLVADLRERTAKVARGGSEEARARHLARGKLLARDRIDALIDPGSALLELSPLETGRLEVYPWRHAPSYVLGHYGAGRSHETGRPE